MQRRVYKLMVLGATGMVFGLFPSCVNKYVLNLATPFLLGQI
ncbi:MAG: hypothetical protein ACYTHJ_15565 [Planctomycetota bacterium]|jgi:hypothetical protein